MMKPNDSCDDRFCCLRQKEYQQSLALNPVKETKEEKVDVVKHEDNEWGIHITFSNRKRHFVILVSTSLFLKTGISLVDESEPITETRTELVPGIHAAYDLPDVEATVDESSETVDTSVSLEELMAQMKSI